MSNDQTNHVSIGSENTKDLWCQLWNKWFIDDKIKSFNYMHFYNLYIYRQDWVVVQNTKGEKQTTCELSSEGQQVFFPAMHKNMLWGIKLSSDQLFLLLRPLIQPQSLKPGSILFSQSSCNVWVLMWNHTKVGPTGFDQIHAMKPASGKIKL